MEGENYLRGDDNQLGPLLFSFMSIMIASILTHNLPQNDAKKSDVSVPHVRAFDVRVSRRLDCHFGARDQEMLSKKSCCGGQENYTSKIRCVCYLKNLKHPKSRAYPQLFVSVIRHSKLAIPLASTLHYLPTQSNPIKSDVISVVCRESQIGLP